MADETKPIQATDKQAKLLLEALHMIGWKGSEVLTIAPVIAQLEARNAAPAEAPAGS